MTLKQVIEALVFASPKPLQTGELLAAVQTTGERAEEDGPERELGAATEEQITAVLQELRQEYADASRGYILVEQVNGWGLLTNPAAAAWVRRLYPEAKPTRLSGPALETLAIIAYRQPVTRADIEAVRGVAVDGVMQVLLDRSLVKISGRAEVPGRPLLYSTTEFFLQHFGLKTTEELPNSSELRRIALPTAPVPEGTPEGAEVAVATKPGRKGKKAAVEAAPADAVPMPAVTEAVPSAEGEVASGPPETGAAEVPVTDRVEEGVAAEPKAEESAALAAEES